MKYVALILTSIATATFAAEHPPGIPAHYKLQYEQAFDQSAALADFVATEARAWRLAEEGSGRCLELFAPGLTNLAKAKPGAIPGAAYKPPFRSPLRFALLADKAFGDFILELDMQSTVKPYGHQDLCLFYNFKSPSEFYYTHIAVAADPNAHNIFIVNQAARKNIAQETTQGITWGQGQWHKVRLERKVSDGSISVYFDDLTKPIMRATDKTFTSGYLGFGTFDDLGKFDNLRIWSPAMEAKKTDFFERLKD